MQTLCIDSVKNIIQRERQERLATGEVTSETLTKLNITVDRLPEKAQKQLYRLLLLSHKSEFVVEPTALLLRNSKTISQELNEDYEILKLRHKNKELQVQIDRNKKAILTLKNNISEGKSSLQSQTVNPQNIQDCIRNWKQKVASYEECYEKALAKFTKLSVPEKLYPRSLDNLVSELAAVKAEEMALKEKADDITLTRQLRDQFTKLRR